VYINETIQKTQYRQYKTQYIQVHTLPKHPHNCQNTPIDTHPHITKQVQTNTECWNVERNIYKPCNEMPSHCSDITADSRLSSNRVKL